MDEGTTKHEALQPFIRDMRLLDPEYDLLPIDFWDEATLRKLTALRYTPGKRAAWTGEVGPYTVIYSRGRSAPIELEIRDTKSGRRLRQDGEDLPELLDLLEVLCPIPDQAGSEAT